jgi:HAD superfamily hydrolase (TIGR01490 family)
VPRAALFDMDRTLLRRESASLWIRYQRDTGEADLVDAIRVGLWVLKYTFGVLRAEEVAAKALRSLEGRSADAFAARCEDWFARYVEEHIADEGRRVVERHRAAGDVLAIVTGATPYAARPLAERLRIENVLASDLEIDARGRFTGRFAPPLCYGHGKVERTLALAKARGFDLEDATFYTDSYTDLPLLERVGEPVVVNPDPRLRREAARRGWRVERW